jgi:hypothetical protein
MGLVSGDDGWRLPDWLWARVESLLPSPPEHPSMLADLASDDIENRT